MQNPKVSVIVPVYNAAKYLRQCLDSLKNQTLTDCEFICVNDGSTDRSKDILEEYAKHDKRFCIFQQENSGVSVARNVGLKNVKGEYTCFVDSDDYVDIHLLEYTYRVALDQNADVVVFGGACFPTKSWADATLTTKNAIVDNNVMEVLFQRNGCRPFVWNKLFRTAIFKENKIYFNHTLTIGEDQAFIFEVFPYVKKIVFTDKKFYFYRQQSASAMSKISSNFTRKITEHIKLVDSVIASWEKKDLIKLYGNQLLIWQSEFLSQGLRECPYNFRKKVNSKIVDFAKRIATGVPLNDESKSIVESKKKLTIGTEVSGRYPLDSFDDSEKITILKKRLADSDKRRDSVEKKLNSKIKRLEKELSDVKKGYSYRIGRIITYIPRKILGRK